MNQKSNRDHAMREAVNKNIKRKKKRKMKIGFSAI